MFCEQRAPGGMQIWKEQFSCLRAPKFFNLRMDPYERADTGPTNLYYQTEVENPYILLEGNRRAAGFLQTFVDYPPSQLPARFTIDQTVADVKSKVKAAMQRQAGQQAPQKK